MQNPKDKLKETKPVSTDKEQKLTDSSHLGSSNAFEETENPLSRDSDDISDEKLDDLLDE